VFVVVELFTSEGCSSCPPADRLLSWLQASQPVEGVQVLALSQHVDYWNDIGWRDPFSSSAFTDRQAQYSGHFANGRIYTPQMIVDGTEEFVGSDRVKALAAIQSAAQLPKGEIEIRPAHDWQPDLKKEIALQIAVTSPPKVDPKDPAEVWLVIAEDGLTSQVSRGENAGRHLSHDGVVRILKSIGTLSPDRTPFKANQVIALSDAWRRPNLRAVAFMQGRKSRRILAASVLKLNG